MRIKSMISQTTFTRDSVMHDMSQVLPVSMHDPCVSWYIYPRASDYQYEKQITLTH